DRLLQIDPLDLLGQQRCLQICESQGVDVVCLERSIRLGGGPRQIRQALGDGEQLPPINALLGQDAMDAAVRGVQALLVLDVEELPSRALNGNGTAVAAENGQAQGDAEARGVNAAGVAGAREADAGRGEWGKDGGPKTLLS